MINIRGPGNTVNQKKAKQLLPSENITLHSALKFAFKSPRNRNYAVYNNGNFVGFALLTPNNKTLNLNLIATKPKRGYGKVLMNKIKANARANGFHHINLYAVNNAVEFYTKQNFKKVPFSQTFRFNLTTR